MKKNVELGFLDHFLVLIACTSALYALGASLAKQNLANFLTVGSAVSILTGFFISRSLVGKKLRNFDGYLWTGIAFATAIFSRALNGFLPDDGFPFMLFAGAWLSWMVLLCGLVSWRDQTLLFLNLPCISIFALVGTFDTFAPATLLFFIFLACSSLLYARIHQRSMISRAKLAGFDSPELLQRDAWRWMAGPEWALASAGVIVVLSLILGPLLRFSLQPVAGSMKVSMPPSTSVNPITAALQQTDLQVGKGPIELGESEVIRVKIANPDYLRTGYFTEYKGNGWSRIRPETLEASTGFVHIDLEYPGNWTDPWPKGVPLEPIQGAKTMELELLGPSDSLSVLPAPGPIVGLYIDKPGNSTYSLSGMVYRRRQLAIGESAKVRYLVPDPNVEPGSSVLPPEFKVLDRYFIENSKTPKAVLDFARRAASGSKNDFDKAKQIKEAIARTAGYTLKAPALSPTSDAVEQFLFSTKKGYCDLFATAMVVCARSVGMRARYTIGYLITDPKKDSDGFYTVRAKDAHSWAEVYLEGKGWAKFDATEGAPILPDEDEEGSRPWYQQRWAMYGFAAVVIALAAGAVAFVKSKLRPIATPKLRTERTQANRLHQEFDRILRRRTGATRRFSQTTSEYVHAVLPRLDTQGPAALVLASALERASYGSKDLDRDEVKLLGQEVKAFGRAFTNSRRS